MTPRLLLLASGRATLALLFALALAAAPQAQVVFDDFETVNGDGNPDYAFGFSGGGAGSGFGPTAGFDGNTALNIGINPGTGGGFAGVGTGVNSNADGNTTAFVAVDASDQTYLTFYFRPTSFRATDEPLVMEIYLQEDLDGDGFDDNTAGDGEDQFRADYRVTAPAGAPEWHSVAIPLASFTDFNPTDGRPVGNNDGLDFSKIGNVVFAFGGLQPNPDANPPQDFALSFDDIVFRDTPVTFATTTTFDDFETVNGDGNPDYAFGFSGGGAGSGFGPTAGFDGNTALNIGINPGTGGGFAGVGTGVNSNADGNTTAFVAVDASDQTYLTFYFRPTSFRATDEPLVMEIYLQEDLDGDGFDDNTAGDGEDQFRADYRVTAPAGAPEWHSVAIPLASFTDFNPTDGRPVGNNDGLDFSKIGNVVFAFGGLQPNPDANPPQDFALSFDDIVFAGGASFSTSTVEEPSDFAVAPIAFPNPTAANATVAFELASPSMVRAEVYDMLGRRVVTLADGSESAGPVRLDVQTEAFVPGTYVIRVQTDAGAAMTRLTVAR